MFLLLVLVLPGHVETDKDMPRWWNNSEWNPFPQSPPFPSIPFFSFPSLRNRLLKSSWGAWGSTVISPAGCRAEPHTKLNWMHSNLKVDFRSLTFLRFSWQTTPAGSLFAQFNDCSRCLVVLDCNLLSISWRILAKKIICIFFWSEQHRTPRSDLDLVVYNSQWHWSRRWTRSW